MRKYQRKLVADVSFWYRGNDPLKWVFISQKLGSSRPMTDRESKILARRIVKWTKKAVNTAQKVIQQFGITMSQASKRMREFAEAVANAKAAESEKQS